MNRATGNRVESTLRRRGNRKAGRRRTTRSRATRAAEGQLRHAGGRGDRRRSPGKHAHHRHRQFVPASPSIGSGTTGRIICVPDDDVGKEAFSVIRDAMEATETVGISRLVLYRRERAVMLEPRDEPASCSGPSATATKCAIREDYFGDIDPEKARLQADVALVDDAHRRTARSGGIPPWSTIPSDAAAGDHAKQAQEENRGRNLPPRRQGRSPSRRANVVNIMDALRRSRSRRRRSQADRGRPGCCQAARLRPLRPAGRGPRPVRKSPTDRVEMRPGGPAGCRR